MTKQRIRTETDLISRLGCMRKNTIIEDTNWGRVEHVEVWVPARGEAIPVGHAGSVDAPASIVDADNRPRGPK